MNESSENTMDDAGRSQFGREAVEACFAEYGHPQGTPLSRMFLRGARWAAERAATPQPATQAPAPGVVEALKNVTVHLIAAHSLLERGGRKAAPSDTMFKMMLEDYARSIEVGRAALSQQPARDPETTRERFDISDSALEALFNAVHRHGEFGRGFREEARQILGAVPDEGAWISREDIEENLRALDAALNGPRIALRPTLADLAAQAQSVFRAQPVLASSASVPILKAAERYMKLRALFWNDGPLAVIKDPKRNAKLGSYMPHGALLDDELDALS